MNRTHCLELADQYFSSGKFLSDLTRRVSFETVAEGPDSHPALLRYLQDEITPALSRMGFECTVIANTLKDGPPMLLAKRIEDPSLPTVLTYGHGDVVSGQTHAWREGLKPWTLTREQDRWYGRGCADNKGQHSINLAGLQSAIEARKGKLGYNVTVLLEMGEEVGSPGLRETCEAHADQLKAQLFIASDGPRLHAAIPTLFLGSRGAANFTLRMRARDRAFHSGNWGGALLNPAIVLSHALASLVDARGRLMVDELRPARLDPSVRRILEGVEIGGDTDDPALEQGWGEPGLSAAERLMGWNTLEILAFGSGNPERPVNAIPGSAHAHCQLRFIVGTPFDRLAEILRSHLDARGFQAIDIEVARAAPASRLDPDSPWVSWASQSLSASTRKKTVVLPNLAGTIPNDVFADVLGLPTIWVPHSYPACAQHAPNEHLLGPVAREGLAIMAGLYWDLGESQQTPWN